MSFSADPLTSVSKESRTHNALPSYLPLSLGWRDLISGQYLTATCAGGQSLQVLPCAPIFNHGPDAALLRLSLPTMRIPLIGSILSLHPPASPSPLGIVVKTHRQADGWDLSVQLISRRYRVLKAHTLDAKWPDGSLNEADVIDFQPADLPPGQRALLIRATRTSSLALSMPWTIHFEDRKWVRAGRPVQRGHLVACFWSPLQTGVLSEPPQHP